jgi:hypothetical protein
LTAHPRGLCPTHADLALQLRRKQLLLVQQLQLPQLLLRLDVLQQLLGPHRQRRAHGRLLCHCSLLQQLHRQLALLLLLLAQQRRRSSALQPSQRLLLQAVHQPLLLLLGRGLRAEHP